MFCTSENPSITNFKKSEYKFEFRSANLLFYPTVCRSEILILSSCSNGTSNRQSFSKVKPSVSDLLYLCRLTWPTARPATGVDRFRDTIPLFPTVPPAGIRVSFQRCNLTAPSFKVRGPVGMAHPDRPLCAGKNQIIRSYVYHTGTTHQNMAGSAIQGIVHHCRRS